MSNTFLLHYVVSMHRFVEKELIIVSLAFDMKYSYSYKKMCCFKQNEGSMLLKGTFHCKT